MLKNIGLFCKRDLQKRPIFCKETYIFKHPTNRSHPILESLHTNSFHSSIQAHTIISAYTSSHVPTYIKSMHQLQYALSISDRVYLNTFIWGWLWIVGSFKIYVSFAKEPYKRDYILKKRPVFLRSLLIIATPYFSFHSPHFKAAHRLETHHHMGCLRLVGSFEL